MSTGPWSCGSWTKATPSPRSRSYSARRSVTENTMTGSPVSRTALRYGSARGSRPGSSGSSGSRCAPSAAPTVTSRVPSPWSVRVRVSKPRTPVQNACAPATSSTYTLVMATLIMAILLPVLRCRTAPGTVRIQMPSCLDAFSFSIASASPTSSTPATSRRP